MGLKSLKDERVTVTYFQRRPRKGFSFSLEYIFNDVRNRLENRIKAEVKISKLYNNGFATKIYNLVEASLRQGLGVNHVTGEIHFITILMKKKSVVLTILDCGMIHRKSGIAREIIKLLYLKWPVRSSAFVTCISEATKQEVLKYTGCNPDKVKVIPVAVDPIYQPHPKQFNIVKPNILHIGVGYNKNLYRLIEALEGINCELTIVGKLDKSHVDELSKRQVTYSNFYDLSQAEILQRYIECDILSFVSTFEGFGMPIIEANAVERVVISSNISSMPEIAAGAACLVDPYNVVEIRKGIQKLITDAEYRDRLISNGRINKLRFNADKIADSYFELYEKMCSQ